MSDIPFGIPSDPYEQAKMLENVMIAACEGKRDNSYDYEEIRTLFMKDPAIRPLLPDFVRTCRDLNHFWGYI